MLPEHIQNKILLYNIHPVAEMIKKYLKCIKRGRIFFELSYLTIKWYHKYTECETLYIENFNFRYYSYWWVKKNMLNTIRF